MLNEAMVRHIVGVEGAQALLEVTRGAWDDYVAEGRPRFHRSTRAAVIWDYMVLRAEDLLAQMDGVRTEERYQRPLYVLRDAVILRPKMHDRDLLTRNYQTRAQAWLAVTGRFEELEYPNVSFGYKLDAAEAGVEQCVITSPSDNWVIDLEDLAAGNLQPSTAMFEMPVLDEPWQALQSIRFRRGS